MGRFALVASAMIMAVGTVGDETRDATTPHPRCDFGARCLRRRRS
jgi:hypothetical protein